MNELSFSKYYLLQWFLFDNIFVCLPFYSKMVKKLFPKQSTMVKIRGHKHYLFPYTKENQGVPTVVSNVFMVVFIKCKYVFKIDLKIPLQKCIYS